MIIEGLLTTTNAAGSVNIAPMGPVVRGDFQALTLRPFAGSTTFENLITTKTAVFHVVDRVGVIAAAAIGKLQELPAHEPAKQVPGVVMDDCCRWFELEITGIDTRQPRSVMESRIVHTGEKRPFQGFNRARHAVIEAAILSTRLHLLPQEEVEAQMKTLLSAVDKTGDDEEQSAFRMLTTYVEDFYVGAASA